MAKDKEPVTVLEAGNAVEIELARDLLVKAGIPCAVRAHLGSIYGAVLAGARALEVMPEHAARARDVLAEAWGTQES